MRSRVENLHGTPLGVGTCTAVRETGTSLHDVCPNSDAPQTSRQYCTEELRGNPQLCPKYAEICAPLERPGVEIPTMNAIDFTDEKQFYLKTFTFERHV